MIAQVLPDQAAGKILDYSIPEALREKIGPGSRVRVPVRSRLLPGTVIALAPTSEAERLRDVVSVIGDKPMIRAELLDLARWMADYYCCSLEVATRSVLPVAVRDGRVSEKILKGVRLVREPTEAEWTALRQRSPRQAAACEVLKAAGKALPLAEAARMAGVSEPVFRTLEKHGWAEIAPLHVHRDPYSRIFVPTAELPLNAEQEAVLAQVTAAINQPGARPMLLFGVTGSGKTEIYLRAIRHAIDQGRTALVLVPEIALTPQTVERFKSRFAAIQNEVAVLHSHLSDGERHDEWHKIHSGAARIVIGARSSIFAPLERLGIIIVDEEHENSYKQDEAPRYHARDMAVLRAHREGAAVLLGTATPSLESWHNVTTGKYALLRLTQRADDKKMPIVRVIDMRQHGKKSPEGGALSGPLVEAIKGRLAKGEQTILFLNRRGFSTSMLCEACGHVVTCPDCSVSLTYHRTTERLVCHICGHVRRAPKVCPKCSDPSIRYSGMGTQKVEEIAKKIFAEARIARMDADSMTRKDAYEETLGAFREGRIDILIGTQMIAKGLHFPNVTLVGIVNADLGLHLPDFRAGERTFQLLTQVAGRAGRGEMEGEVFVQTFTPFSPSIQFARHHDFEGFMEQEMEFRRQFHYPPYGRMALITVRGVSRDLVELSATTLSKRLTATAPAGVQVGEAAPAPLEKAKTYYRFQVSLRGPSSPAIARCIRETLAGLSLPADLHAAVDIDAIHLL